VNNMADPVDTKTCGTIKYTFVKNGKACTISAVDRLSKRHWTRSFETVPLYTGLGITSEQLYAALTTGKGQKSITLPGSVPSTSTLVISVVIDLGVMGDKILNLELHEKEVSEFDKLQMQINDLRSEIQEMKATDVIKVSTFSFADEKKVC